MQPRLRNDGLSLTTIITINNIEHCCTISHSVSMTMVHGLRSLDFCELSFIY